MSIVAADFTADTRPEEAIVRPDPGSQKCLRGTERSPGCRAGSKYVTANLPRERFLKGVTRARITIGRLAFAGAKRIKSV